MKRAASWLESSLLGFIASGYQSHVLGHAVPVIVRRTERVISTSPTWREDDKVSDGSAVFHGRRGENSEDGRVLEGMGW